MKNIIVPIDFTSVSMNALKYASKAFPNDRLHLLHVVRSGLNTSEVVPASFQKMDTTQDKMLIELEKLILLELDLNEIPETFIINIRKGDITSQIKEFAILKSADCLVMGTKDKYDIFEKAIGSISFATVKTLDIPIYLIPKNSTYNGFKRVAVATDKDLKESHFGRKVKDWNKDHNAFVQFIHVATNEAESYIEEIDSIASDLFEENEPTFAFEIKRTLNKNIKESLLQAAYQFKADLLITLPQKQSFLGTLLFKNLTKELVQNSKVPILFFDPPKTF